ncbi:amino acid/polyamine/organocation transporter (APC superfamily) [Nonomuraea polychroma]|uniref:Amino acid/polyamine/organocation transporter (APC superfamily) n=1 Tax=Nonomuraea polychroma TaxID=46176 RepID=A0A438M0W6_9ACTN|nr:amino acid permease [Nonomuraea polychroma]RVX39449.1 amino acid/polyamine/organocation transporter (APC superfamily) [Nonomuraea polychroma]
MTLAQRLLRTKPTERLVAEGGHGEGGDLRRTMSLWQLTLFSVGATLGTGIFVILGQAVPKAGPAVVLSFVLAAITALFSALSYAELAGTIPVSGSSYSYAYATLGELVAWICGWCLMLEYAVSVAAVAVGWGEYLNSFLRSLFGFTLPEAITRSPGQAGGVVNVTAILIVLLATWLLLHGASESAAANAIFVLIKVAVLLFFCAVAFTAFRVGNFAPFAPMGVAGITAAASQVFFSYIGFDAASTAGEEAKNPRRDLPLAIIFSLAIVTAIYVLVAVAAVGALPWTEFDPRTTEASLSYIADLATGATWPGLIVSFGAVIAIASVVLTVIFGQTRILFAMSRDGLIPRVFQQVNPRRQVPVANTLIVAAFISVLAGLVPLGQLAEATSIGTLFAFGIVNVGVLVLRYRSPGLPRSFRVPLFPVTPVLGAVFCVLVMAGLAGVTWLAFGLWMLVGLVCYFLYGYSHSRLNAEVR